MIPNTHNVEVSVMRALAPFNEHLEVEPYRVHLDRGDIARMKAHFSIPSADADTLATLMRAWTGQEGGVDETGLYRVSTFNPDGRYDWYEIGGRWDGSVPGSVGNVIRSESLALLPSLQAHLPYALVTPDGEWIEHEQFPFVKSSNENAEDSQWLAQVSNILRRWPDHLVVCVDVHS